MISYVIVFLPQTNPPITPISEEEARKCSIKPKRLIGTLPIKRRMLPIILKEDGQTARNSDTIGRVLALIASWSIKKRA